MANDNDEDVGIQKRAKAALLSSREYRRITQREMAAMLRVGLKSYEKYESTEPDPKTHKVRKVPTKIITRLCIADNCSTDWIMLGKKQAVDRKAG
jgi:hypothetical protein